MELDIAFEDEHLLILNKSAPLAVIPSSLSPGEPTLAGASRGAGVPVQMARYCRKKSPEWS